MNANEVIGNRGIEIMGGEIGSKKPIHPNDDVNRSQSSNDVFPSAMHIAVVSVLTTKLMPALSALNEAIEEKAADFSPIVKTGRTHFMDATPITLGQEFSGYCAQIREAIAGLNSCLEPLRQLVLGGTAVGTGLGAHPDFAARAIAHISQLTGEPFKVAENKFAGISGHGALVQTSSALRGLAVVLCKVANDIRFMASGPRSGIGELILPSNEPGSSMMPGKINPTQCEALIMVAYQVMGHDVAVGLAGAHGNLELNTCKPLIIHNILDSATLLAESCRSFCDRCVRGLAANGPRIAENLANSPMLVTALVPAIGYEAAAKIAQKAIADNISIKQAAIGLKAVTEEEFEKWVNPKLMTEPVNAELSAP